MNKYWPIHGCIRETVIIHQKPVILTKQAIVLVNAGIGEYNGADRFVRNMVLYGADKA
jgi:hypothetical protein